MKFMRRPDQQVLTWKAFIGPSIKAATLDKAPPDIQKLVQEHWRPEYTDMEKKYKIVPQLPVKELIAAMDRWDKGSARSASRNSSGMIGRLRFRLSKHFGAKNVLDDF